MNSWNAVVQLSRSSQRLAAICNTGSFTSRFNPLTYLSFHSQTHDTDDGKERQMPCDRQAQRPTHTGLAGHLRSAACSILVQHSRQGTKAAPGLFCTNLLWVKHSHITPSSRSRREPKCMCMRQQRPGSRKASLAAAGVCCCQSSALTSTSGPRLSEEEAPSSAMLFTAGSCRRQQGSQAAAAGAAATGFELAVTGSAADNAFQCAARHKMTSTLL